MKKIYVVPMCFLSMIIGLGIYQFNDGKEIIRANRFELLDAEGKVRGVFGLSKSDNNPYIELLSKDDSKTMVELSISSFDQATFTLSSKNSKSRITMQEIVNGDLSLTLSDSAMNPRININLDKNGVPSIHLADEKMNPRAVLWLDKDNNGRITFYDKNRKAIK